MKLSTSVQLEKSCWMDGLQFTTTQYEVLSASAPKLFTGFDFGFTIFSAITVARKVSAKAYKTYITILSVVHYTVKK